MNILLKVIETTNTDGKTTMKVSLHLPVVSKTEGLKSMKLDQWYMESSMLDILDDNATQEDKKLAILNHYYYKWGYELVTSNRTESGNTATTEYYLKEPKMET